MDTPTQPPTDPPAGPPASRLVLGSTSHLLASVPHLLGYQPGRSVVLMASTPEQVARGPRRMRAVVRMTARFDLPDPQEALAVVSTLAAPLAQAGGPAGPLLLHAFVYEADDDVAASVAAAVAVLAREGGHRLQDLVLVRDSRFLPLVAGGGDGPDPSACWAEVPDPADVPAVADLVLQGRCPADSRDDVAARVRRRDEPAAAATELALSFLQVAPETFDPVDALRRLGTWVVHGESEPAARDRARIAVALADRTVRDAVMARWLPRLFTVEEVVAGELARDVRGALPPWPGVDVAGALDRVLGLASRVPEPDAVPLLTVAGALAWGSGEGTVANEAIDLALETDPGYTMAQLLRKALDRGLPPWLRPVQERPADVA
jgi:hypothetical protein